jgi:hypothetical protein
MELRNWEPYGLQSSANVISVMMSGKLRWAWGVAYDTCGGEEKYIMGFEWVGLKEREVGRP